MSRTPRDESTQKRTPPKSWLTVREVAECCAVSQDAVRAAIARGELKGSKVFGTVRVREADLERYVEARVIGPPAQRPSKAPAYRGEGALAQFKRQRAEERKRP